jgi:thioredoxin 1
MGHAVIHATDQNFDQEIKTTVPVLIDFWAEWCGPCRVVGPVIDELAGEYQGKLKVLKVNVDDNQSTAVRFQVMSIPTLLFLKNGQEVDKIIGALPKNARGVCINRKKAKCKMSQEQI